MILVKALRELLTHLTDCKSDYDCVIDLLLVDDRGNRTCQSCEKRGINNDTIFCPCYARSKQIC